MGRNLDIFGYLDELGAVAALLAGNTADRLARGNLDFFHGRCCLP
jgi:hypothetical protein